MATFAISMVKDEADVILGSITRMLAQVDAVIVADNGSTDGTREILAELPVEVVDDDEVAYYQSVKMSALAQRAADQGADWVVPFDADEVWLTPHGRIADVLADRSEIVAAAPILNHVATGRDSAGVDPIETIGWRSVDPLPLPKVACRPRLPVTIEQGNHGASYPSGIATGLLEVRHFPYRSAEQFLSKVRNGAAAYAASDLPDFIGEHWRQYGELLDREGSDAVQDWFREHFWNADPEAAGLVYDPVS